ncbi:mechanosensitive ion channel family protein [Adhaeribacter terreus]|uniref:Mechanosensitive ion channel family protein n=1 Tax=Adhaeribacter terreus TaxID=529703 RepID=A0ABW0E9D9_9BACT
MKEFFDKEFFNYTFYHNTVLDYIIAFGIIFLGISLVKLLKRKFVTRIRTWAEKTTNRFDDFIANSLERFGIPFLYLIVVFFGFHYLSFPQKTENFLKIGFTVAFTFILIRVISTVILALLQNYVRHQERGEEKVKQLGGIMLIINFFIWAIGLIFLFDNMGFDVTTVITGLGIGGIAIALAAQNILGDLFNYFVIFFDRPFETGDFITIDEKNGTVDYIGIKTTRITSLSGEQLIVANSDLTNSRIHNYKRLHRRRVSFTIGVTYQTSPQNLRQIPAIMKNLINKQEDTTFDRSHFVAYNDSSLDFETIYYVENADMVKHLNIRQEIFLDLFEEFSRRKIDFAYPTRTLFMEPVTAIPEQNEEKKANPIIQPN